MSFRFTKFKVYKDSQELHIQIVQITSAWPHSYLYLADQLKRATLSIVLNIAEGSSKQSDKDFNRFLTISLGSVDETVACLEIACKFNLISKAELERLEIQYGNISRQLGGFSKVLRVRSEK